MLHARFQDHHTSSFEEEFKDFTFYGQGGQFGHVTWAIYINFCIALCLMPIIYVYINFRPLYPRRLQIKFSYDCQSGFREADA